MMMTRGVDLCADEERRNLTMTRRMRRRGGSLRLLALSLPSWSFPCRGRQASRSGCLLSLLDLVAHYFQLVQELPPDLSDPITFRFPVLQVLLAVAHSGGRLDAPRLGFCLGSAWSVQLELETTPLEQNGPTRVLIGGTYMKSPGNDMMSFVVSSRAHKQ